MARTREIRGRIRAVTNIQRITKTMQMIATARFQAALKRAVASQPYSRHIRQMVGELSVALAASGQTDAGTDHPLLRGPQPVVGRSLVLVISSNRGLCGGYNAALLRTAAHTLRAQSGEVDVEVVGKKAMAYFRFSGRRVSLFHNQFGDRPGFDEVEALAQRYVDLFTAGRYDAVRVVSTAFVSVSRQMPRVSELLPLRSLSQEMHGHEAHASGSHPQAPGPRPQSSMVAAKYDFYPDPKKLLAELLPLSVKAQLFQCFNEAVVSEQLARMVAMKSATDAAGKMKRSLTQRYNRARQSAITTELMEVIGGATAFA